MSAAAGAPAKPCMFGTTQRPSTTTADANCLEEKWLPGAFGGQSSGTCELEWEPPREDEASRDFARVFLASGSSRLFLASLNPMVGQPPLLQNLRTDGDAAPGSVAGDLGPDTVADALREFVHQLECACVVAHGSSDHISASIVKRIIEQMGAGLCVRCLAELKLSPVFLQPVFVILTSDRSSAVRLITYGFVAGCSADIRGDRPDTKCTSCILRLMTSDLTSDTSEQNTLHYAAQRAEGNSILTHVAADVRSLLSAPESLQGA